MINNIHNKVILHIKIFDFRFKCIQTTCVDWI